MIIGICGKRGTGKTTLADYWVKTQGFTKVSFAGKLKNVSMDLWGNAILLEPKEEPFLKYKWTPREFMIEFGQFMRKFDSDYWLKETLYECMDIPGTVVIDDVRFKNEADFIRKNGGIIIRLNRKPELNIYKFPLNDISETNLDDYKYDYMIGEDTNTSLISLFGEADSVLEKIKCSKTT